MGGVRSTGEKQSPGGVIFDMDGVLVDSKDAHFASWQALGAERQFTMSWEQFLLGFGRTSREILREQLPDRHFSDAELQELDERKELLYREQLRDCFQPIPGVLDLIEELRRHGFPLAVGSSGPPENVSLVLELLGNRDRFAGVTTGADVRRGKPDPEVFLLAASKIGIAPERCVVIEDAPAGIAAARRAGMRCIGLTTSFPADRLQEADLVVDSLTVVSAETIRKLLPAG